MMLHNKNLGRKIRRVINGWNFAWMWHWNAPRAGKGRLVNFDILHIGLEAGRYKGNYAELTVVVLGVGFYVEWYDQLTRSVWGAGIEQSIAGAKEFLDLEKTNE